MIIKPGESFEAGRLHPSGNESLAAEDRAAPNDYIVLICWTVRYYPLLNANPLARELLFAAHDAIAAPSRVTR